MAIWYKQAYHLEADIEQRALNFRTDTKPGDATNSDFWGRFCQAVLKLQKRWDVLDLLDPSRYLSEIPKDWGFSYYQKHQTFVSDRHLFATVAVMARYFRKEFEERLKTVPNSEAKNLALEAMNLVGSRFGISP
jgi:hypothetical protein